MSQTRERIMEVVVRSPGCSLEDLVLQCPDLTWNQVFCELDTLSRGGHIRLMQKGPGRYTVTRTATATLNM
jgi:hypothetical protein